MRRLVLIGALAALTGCERYTDQTSPCVGRNGKPMVSRGIASPALSFSTTVSPVVSHTATDHDCVFRAIGAAE